MTAASEMSDEDLIKHLHLTTPLSLESVRQLCNAYSPQLIKRLIDEGVPYHLLYQCASITSWNMESRP